MKLKLSLLVFAFYFGTLKYGYCQKNRISLTPLKTLIFEKVELNYKREIKNNFFYSTDLQIWFFDREPISILPNDSPEPRSYQRNVCKGFRHSFGVHKYLNNKKKKRTNWHLGFNLFYGYHTVEKHYETISGKGSTGNIGGKLTFGAHIKKPDGFFIDLGLDWGNSWLTQKETGFKIYNPNTGTTRKITYPWAIYGVFFDPKLAIGYEF